MLLASTYALLLATISITHAPSVDLPRRQQQAVTQESNTKGVNSAASRDGEAVIVIEPGTRLEIRSSQPSEGVADNSGTGDRWALVTAFIALCGTGLGVFVTYVTSHRAEKRLASETLTKSAELLRASKDRRVTEVDRALVLFSLMRLGETPFALRLLGAFWHNRQITSSNAMWVLNEILSMTDLSMNARVKCLINWMVRRRWLDTTNKRIEDLRDYAANALRAHADQLLMPNGAYE